MADFNPPVRTRFDNGLELWSIANELLSASQVGFVRGSRNDPSTMVGMTHLIEHLWCRGASAEAVASVVRRCPKRPAPVSSERADLTYRKYFGGSNGAGINVYTLHSHMGFGHQDLFRTRHLPEVFPVMAGMVRDGMYDVRDMRTRSDAVVSREAFETERWAVLHETAENDEWPAMIGYRAGLKTLYESNPARHFGDCEPDQLYAVKIGRVKFWAQDHLVPRNFRVVILGPSRNAAVRLVRQAGLNRIPDWPSAKWGYDHGDDLPVLTGVKHLELRGGGKMRHVCLFWPTEACGSPDAYALQVLEGVIKDRVEFVLRERRRAVYHPTVEWDATSSSGFFSIQFSTLKGDADTDAAITSVLDAVEEVKTEHSEWFVRQVEAARFNLANAYLEDYRYTPGAFADRMMRALANGDPKLERFNAYPADMLRVSPVRVSNAAKKYLHRDRFVLTVVRPQPSL